ncbi:phage tail protein [Pseudomonas fluorescens]|uniref:phage tail-collar fiber domain-containing protein n=1 Tax=Pseudomonas fluorescens TaxID=294 RepID=UPI0002EE8AA9|nr:phage tail protein [Pseudomonas fluorescens]
MIDQNSQFFAILTNIGAAKQANADALGIPWKITQMGVGDANGADPIPAATQTALINERRRAPLNQLKVDPANTAVIIAEQVIPAEVGGWWIREIGLYDADNDLVAIANCAPSFKPLLTQGSGRTQVVRMNLIVSNSSSVELKIDPSVVLATRAYVDSKVLEELNKQDFKHSVLVATTGPIALNGLQSIDGIAVTAGKRVLVKDQAAGKDNGLYVAAAGAWSRSEDADASTEITPGLFVHVEQGTASSDSIWQLTTDSPIVLGITALSFEMIVGRTGITAGTYRSVSVDKNGRVIGATNPTTLAGNGIVDAYTKTEVAAMIAQASALPVGTMVGFPVNKIAPGFLEIDGSVQSIATYPDLAAFLGTAFNQGNEGAGNFRLPESRGEFLRGWDHGRGVDAGRAIGSFQADDLKAHTHKYGNTHNATYGLSSTGVIGVNPSASINYDTSSVGGTETRPRNLAVMWCIKAWNTPVNQGTIDISALAAEVQTLRNLAVSRHKGLFVSATGTAAQLAIKARRLIVGSGGPALALDNVDVGINLATVGLGGLDSGVLAASSWYSGWVATNGAVRAGIAVAMPSVICATTAGSPVVTGIANTASMRAGMPFGGAAFPPGTVISSVDSPSQITASQPAITTSAAAALLFMYEPVLPAGYTAVRVTAFFTDATNKYPLRYRQRGRQVKWLIAPGTNVVSSRSVTGGIVGTWSATAPVWAEASLVNFVPITAVSASFTAIASYNGTAQSNVCIAPNAAYLGSRTQVPPPISTTLAGGTGAAPDVMSADIMLESMSVFVVSQTAAGAVVIHGYEDDV